MQNANPSRESSISVAVRVRPFTPSEATHLTKPSTEAPFLGDGSLSVPAKNKVTRATPRGLRKIVNVVDNNMLIFDPPESNPLQRMQRNAFPDHKHARIREYRFVFDRLFDEEASQAEVYEATTKPLLDSVLDGFNATVFAYGATGCGKTHTISGTPSAPGIIFLTMRELFARIDALRDTRAVDVSLSYLEIYNETIRDLLSPGNGKPLILREDVNQRISVSNLSVHQPVDVGEVMHMITVGNENRTSSPTEANATSSRSHAVLQINVAQRARTASVSEPHSFATLSVIDLAGSERASATRNRGQRLTEGANINKSLLALGNCINALCDPRRRQHIPYRDSKLTRLLKFSLGGNCKTVMIVCVSPSSAHYDETLNTLKYADRAKEIKTKVQRNTHNLDRHVGSYLKMITEQKAEIDELRTREAAVVARACATTAAANHALVAEVQTSLASLSSSLRALASPKTRRAQMLAKRKLLLLQKQEAAEFLAKFASVFKGDMRSYETLVPGLAAAKHRSEAWLAKVERQIAELEREYEAPLETDLVLQESAAQMVRKLSEHEQWTDSMGLLFEAHVSLLRDAVERDVLFQASVMYDQLVEQVRPLRSLSALLLRLLAGCMDAVALGVPLVPAGVVQRLCDTVAEYNGGVEWMVNGEFDQTVARAECFGAVPFSETPTPETARPPFASKRANSPLGQPPSPDRAFKITRGATKSIKKVRWDVPTADSDISMDEDRSFVDASAMDITLGSILPDEGLPRRSLTARPLRHPVKKNGDMDEPSSSLPVTDRTLDI